MPKERRRGKVIITPEYIRPSSTHAVTVCGRFAMLTAASRGLPGDHERLLLQGASPRVT